MEKLSIHWDQDKVREIFQNFGTVVHVSLPKDKKTNSFKGFGFIEFSSRTFSQIDYGNGIAEDVQKALSLNGYRDPSWVYPIVVMTKKEWSEVGFLRNLWIVLDNF